MQALQLRYAALIPIGNSPLVQLIIDVILVGLAIWGAIWLLDKFAAPRMDATLYQFARVLIYVLGFGYILIEALDVIFGISLFSGAR